MKKLLLVLSFLISVILISSCSKSVPAYEFPLRETDVEKFIEMKKLPYHLKKTQSFRESQAVYTLETDEGAMLFIESNGFEEERFLCVQWYLPNDFTIEKLENFQTVEIPRLFELLKALYGNSKEAKTSSRDFFDYINSIDCSKDNDIFWIYREGDNHYKFKMSQWTQTVTKSNTGLLSIMNSKAFEQDLNGRAKVLIESIRSENSVLHEAQVDEILKMESDGEFPDNEVQMFVVRGNINYISKPDARPKLLKLVSGNLQYEKDNFISGKLQDSTSSMEIYIQPTSLTDKELKQDRNHYIARLVSNDEPIYILIYSTLVE